MTVRNSKRAYDDEYTMAGPPMGALEEHMLCSPPLAYALIGLFIFALFGMVLPYIPSY